MLAAQTSRATATQSADTAAKHTGAAFIIIITTGLDRSLQSTTAARITSFTANTNLVAKVN